MSFRCDYSFRLAWPAEWGSSCSSLTERAVARRIILRDLPRVRPLDTRPIPLSEGVLPLWKAQSGSASVLLGAFGVIADILLSRPVQPGLTLEWVWEHRSRVRHPDVFRPERVNPNDAALRVADGFASAMKAVESDLPLRATFELQPDGTLFSSFETIGPGDDWR